MNHAPPTRQPVLNNVSLRSPSDDHFTSRLPFVGLAHYERKINE